MIKPRPTLVISIILIAADVIIGIALGWPMWALGIGAALLGLALASLSMLIGRSALAQRYFQRSGDERSQPNHERIRMLSVSETRTKMGFPARETAAKSLAELVRSATTQAREREK